MFLSLAHQLIGKCVGTDTEISRVVSQGMVDLAVGDPQGHHDISRRVGPGEHVLDLKAGINIPLGHACRFHGFPHLRLEAFALTDGFHGLEGHGFLHAHGNQIGHNIVSCTDRCRQGRLAFLDQSLGVAQPYVCTMGQAGNPDQLRHGGRPGIIQHAHNEFGTKFRHAQRADVNAAVLLRRNAQRFRR